MNRNYTNNINKTFPINTDDVEEIPTATVIVEINNNNNISKPSPSNRKLSENLPSKSPKNKNNSNSINKNNNNFDFDDSSQTGNNRKGNTNPSDNTNGLKLWPHQLREQVMRTFDRQPNEELANKFFDKHKWPVGLRETVFKGVRKVAIRFYIVDDSGSMITNDGKKPVANSVGVKKLVKCTRWSELSDTLLFLAEMSESLQAPTEFRLLNGADPVLVGLGDDEGESLKFLKEVLEEYPAGPTPLCTHINAVVREISLMSDALRGNGQKACVIIATDGESSDGNVAKALKPLASLPVLVVLRLCTDEQKVIDYWDGIDNQLEIDIDVLDDLKGDAQQVMLKNGWMTYAEPIHILREFGSAIKELDLIDESTLSSEQMRFVCAQLFLGGKVNGLPHPGADWNDFLSKVKTLNAKEPKVFCAIRNQMVPWIDISKLVKTYGKENGTSSSSCNIM